MASSDNTYSHEASHSSPSRSVDGILSFVTFNVRVLLGVT